MRGVTPRTHLSPGALQRLMTDAWPPVERAQLGEWELRAGHGFTGRANSALAVGSPGLPLPEALTAVQHWYAARDLPASLVVAGPLGFDPAMDPAGAAALALGWRSRVLTLTLTAAVDDVRRHQDRPPSGVELRVDPVMSEGWFQALTRYRAADRTAVAAVVHGSPAQRFVTAVEDDVVIGIGRLGVSGAWAGVGAMWVDAAHRQRGLARTMVNHLAHEANSLGASWIHLQTDSDNRAALALYRSMGFTDHHAYVYLAA